MLKNSAFPFRCGNVDFDKRHLNVRSALAVRKCTSDILNLGFQLRELPNQKTPAVGEWVADGFSVQNAPNHATAAPLELNGF